MRQVILRLFLISLFFLNSAGNKQVFALCGTVGVCGGSPGAVLPCPTGELCVAGIIGAYCELSCACGPIDRNRAPCPGVYLTPTISIPPFNLEGPNAETFNAINPLRLGGGDTLDIPHDTYTSSRYANLLSSPGGIISRMLQFIFPIAGLILFVMLVWGGFEMLVGAPSKKSTDAGRQRVGAALVGFLLLFSGYWIWQIVQVVFGVAIF